MLTPAEIQARTFDRRFRGYGTRGVDEFLEALVLEHEEALTERASLQERSRELESRLAEHAELERRLRQTLVSASVDAELRRREARADADAILEAAQVEAREWPAAAERERDRLTAEI